MHSMTGFGRGSATTEDFTATVEIAAVNRKQSEVVVQGTRDLADLEPRIRRAVTQATSRGRLQVTLKLDPTAKGAKVPRLSTVQLSKPLRPAALEVSAACCAATNG